MIVTVPNVFNTGRALGWQITLYRAYCAVRKLKNTNISKCNLRELLPYLLECVEEAVNSGFGAAGKSFL